MNDENIIIAAALLAAARTASNVELDTLIERVAKRHVEALRTVQRRVTHERWLADDQIARLEEMIGLKDALITSLKSTLKSSARREIAGWHGANDNALEFDASTH